MLRSSASLAGSLAWKPGSPLSKRGAGAPDDRAAFQAALIAEILRQDRALLAGIAAYQKHPYRRMLPEPATAWHEGGTRLLDYAPRRAGPAVLFVPSLVNRATVLDLAPRYSLMRWLAARGFRPLLLDWGRPEEQERRFTLTDYIAGRLERAIAAAHALARERIVLAGYCMGGNLALAAALRQPARLRGLALLATPWDFHADSARLRGMALARAAVEPMLALTGTLPTDLLQTLFALLEPFGVTAKYRAFAALEPTSPEAAHFVALEDWLNDGVPLAAPVARECLGGWYGENRTARGRWLVAGQAVDPSQVTLPALVVVPGRDRLVPPASARPLAHLIRGSRLLEPAAGHIGMVAGRGAKQALWHSLLAWLQQLPP
jgi:polyhydroxyalkanoate synthase subunit PhaC